MYINLSSELLNLGFVMGTDAGIRSDFVAIQNTVLSRFECGESWESAKAGFH